MSTDGGSSFADRGVLPTSTVGDGGNGVLATDTSTGRVYLACPWGPWGGGMHHHHGMMGWRGGPGGPGRKGPGGRLTVAAQACAPRWVKARALGTYLLAWPLALEPRVWTPAPLNAALLGQDRPFTATPWFWSDQYDKKLQMAGLSMGADAWAVRGDMAAVVRALAHLLRGDPLDEVEGWLGHGLVSGALFLCVGVIYDRLHTRDIAKYGGLANNMPGYSLLFLLFTMASVSSSTS